MRERILSRLARALTAIKETAIEAFVTLFGEENEFTIGTRRGFGALCSVCQRDVHDIGEQCPRAMNRWCADCRRTRELDRFGNCSVCGSHSIDYRDRSFMPQRRNHLAAVPSSAAAPTPHGMVMRT